MRNRRIVVIAIGLVSAVGFAVRLAERGDLPSLEHPLEAITAPVSALFSSADASPADSADGGRASADASAAVHHQTAPLSSAQLGAPLVHGAFVSACGAPETMKVVVKATVRMGRAIEVTATTNPPSPSVAACVDHSVRELRWDVSPKTEHVTVTY